MATPAPARKPAKSVGERERVPLQPWFLEKLDADKYTAVPTILARRGFRIFKGVQIGIILNILSETIGNEKSGRAEWGALSISEFSKRLNCTEMQVRNAISALEKMKAIESDEYAPDRRRRQYRILHENWGSLPDLPARTLGDAETSEEEEPEPDNTATPVAVLAKLTVKAGGKSKATLGNTPYEFRNRTAGALSVEASGDHRRVFIEIAEHYRNSSCDISAGQQRPVTSDHKPAAAAASEPTPGPSSGRGHFSDRIEPLRQLLTPIFHSLFERTPDDRLLRRIDAELGHATVASFGRLVDKRLKQGPDRVQSGLFVTLASDCRAAFSDADRRAAAAREHREARSRQQQEEFDLQAREEEARERAVSELEASDPHAYELLFGEVYAEFCVNHPRAVRDPKVHASAVRYRMGERLVKSRTAPA